MSNRIPQSFINELLARVDIFEIISSRLTLKKASPTNATALCPFHSEKTPSFTVSIPKQFYHCFGCGAHGNAISFLMNYNKMEYIEAIETLAAQVGLDIPHEVKPEKEENHLELYQLLSQAAQFYQQQLKNCPTAQQYLNSRGLSVAMINHFAIGYAPSAWDSLLQHLAKSVALKKSLIRAGLLVQSETGKVYDRFRNRIMFPIRDPRGRVIGFGGRSLDDANLPKYLNSPETPVFHKGQELYGLYEARQTQAKLDRLLIVEGYMDVIALAQHQFTQVVATLGTATSAKHIQRLFRYSQELIFCFDGDAAGQQAAWRALEISLALMRDGLQIRFMFLPENEDPDSLIRKVSPEMFNDYINKALPLSEFFFKQLCSEVDLDSVDGKAKLAKLAYDKLNKIPQGIFQQLMLEKLNALIGADVEKIINQNAEPKPAKKIMPRAKLSSPVQRAIAVLIQHPNLIEQTEIPEHLSTVSLPGVSLLLEILSLLQQTPQLSTGIILEHWRNNETYKHLAKLAVMDLMIPTTGVAAEFTESVQRILALERESKIQELFNKANQQALTMDEKQKLLNLIADKAT